MNGTHERQDIANVQMGSNRVFGLVFTAVFLVVGALPLLQLGSPRMWALAVSAVFLLAALARPGLLAPLNRLWFQFGLALHRLTNPLVMGIIFFFVITPTAVAMRLFGRDYLKLKLNRNAASYWIKRDPPGPEPKSMERQF